MYDVKITGGTVVDATGAERFDGDVAVKDGVIVDVARGRLEGDAAETIDADQWTVGRYRRDRPLHRIAFDDGERSTVYVSSTNGQVVLRTTATQRFWNWFGAIPHWFYISALRSDGALWSKTVIWASILGTFLTVLGLYLGIAQFQRGKDGKRPPRRNHDFALAHFWMFH